MNLSNFITPNPEDFHGRKTRIRAHDEVEISKGIAFNNLKN